MRKLFLTFTVAVILCLGLHHTAKAQTSCAVQTQAQVLASFADNVPAGAITPQTMRNFVCSVFTPSYLEASAQPNPATGLFIPAALGPSLFTINVTNGATSQKKGISCYVVTLPGGTIPQDAQCIRAFGYHGNLDNTGDFSVIDIVEEGGGNALTSYALCAQTPTIYLAAQAANCANSSYAAEIGSDGGRAGAYIANFGTVAGSTAAPALIVQWWPTSIGGIVFDPWNNAAQTAAQYAWQLTNPNRTSVISYMDALGNIGATSITSTNPANLVGGAYYGAFATSHKPTLSSCGGAGVAAASRSSSYSGTVTIGAAGTGCTVTFALNGTPTPFSSYAFCRVTFQQGVSGNNYTNTTSAITVTGATAASSFDYNCDGF